MNLPGRYIITTAVAGLFLVTSFIAALLATMPEGETVQPIAFNHRVHFVYLRGGAHKREKINMHMKLLGLKENEIPEDLSKGECNACHGEFGDAVKDTPKIAPCAGCHEIFLKTDIRARPAARVCVGCHRNVLNGYTASIPGVAVCAACHAESPAENQASRKLKEHITAARDIPWRRVCDYLPGDIVFSHERHVALGKVDCQICHGDVVESVRFPVPATKLHMEACIECHESAKADTDCLACHR